MPENNNEKSNKGRRHVYLLIGLFVLIIIYFGYYIYSYFTSSYNRLYDVDFGTVTAGNSNRFEAIAIRDETVVHSSGNGYVNFFAGDASAIAVGAQAYVLDPDGELSRRLNEASQNSAVLNENDLNLLKSTIYDFDSTYDPASYYETYTFKYRLQSQILDLINTSVFENINSQVNGSGNYRIVTSDVSGIVQHSLDGFEDYNVDDVSASAFRKTNYDKKIVKSNDYVSQGEGIYKVVTSEHWYLIFQSDDLSQFGSSGTLRFRFLLDDITVTADYTTLTRSGIGYVVIELDKYMVRYVSERYLQIEIISDSVTGLKIPRGAVTEKQFYMIPRDYMTSGGNSSTKGFMKQIRGTGSTSPSVSFIAPAIYYVDDDYYYVSSNDIKSGDVLVQTVTSATYTVNARTNLKGVYVLESGTYTFKVVDILAESGYYYIIDSSTPYGVRVFDQVMEDYTYAEN